VVVGPNESLNLTCPPIAALLFGRRVSGEARKLASCYVA
jgi:hypothetical protein